jgi:hypothetical protein
MLRKNSIRNQIRQRFWRDVVFAKFARVAKSTVNRHMKICGVPQEDFVARVKPIRNHNFSLCINIKLF